MRELDKNSHTTFFRTPKYSQKYIQHTGNARFRANCEEKYYDIGYLTVTVRTTQGLLFPHLKFIADQLQHKATTSDLLRFSTSATSSSVENCPLTTSISCLIASSPQSTSRRPPTTTGKRDGFTYKHPSPHP